MIPSALLPGVAAAGPHERDPALVIEGLTKSFVRGRSEIRVLRGVDLVVRRGEFVALVGASGAGKSTLLQLVGGLDVATGGSVRVDGREIGRFGERELARYRKESVGFVFQLYNLIPTLSAVENAALPLLLAGRPRRAALAEARELLADLGLGERLEHASDELSGGELQRVALARAMIGRPPLLLADEPTGSLDSYTGEELMKLLRRLARARGQTTLMATHDARAAAYADRVLTLKDGVLRGPGTTDARA